jgi:hypothetical protein
MYAFLCNDHVIARSTVSNREQFLTQQQIGYIRDKFSEQ